MKMNNWFVVLPCVIYLLGRLCSLGTCLAIYSTTTEKIFFKNSGKFSQLLVERGDFSLLTSLPLGEFLFGLN